MSIYKFLYKKKINVYKHTKKKIQITNLLGMCKLYVYIL